MLCRLLETGRHLVKCVGVHTHMNTYVPSTAANSQAAVMKRKTDVKMAHTCSLEGPEQLPEMAVSWEQQGLVA